MQYLEGETLAARIARGPVPLHEALRVAIDLSDALATAHRHDIVHRDLKPGNVILTRTGVRLVDFGLARPAIQSGATDTTALSPAGGPMTREGTILGTLHYMAPEQLRGAAADARSDIYALGVLLYEIISGRRPFDAPDHAGLIAEILDRPAPPLAAAAGVPPRLERTVQTAVAKNADDRWQTMRDFGRELTWIAQELSSPAVTTSGVSAPPRRVRRPWLGIGLAAAALAVIGLLGPSVMRRPVATGPPVAILMDSTHPQRVYDPATSRAGGTNADDLTDVLRDLPLSLVKETTGSTWHREDQILAQNPSFILVHRSCFYDATLLDDLPLNDRYFEQLFAPAADKLEMFMGYAALANPGTRFLVYSRGSWATEAERDAWVQRVERRFPRLAGRVVAYKVPLDRATFRNPQTAADVRKVIAGWLEGHR